jgi:replicative DNA helicase|tara:strand:+ start:215 stop:1543 length:1329 start_codon:yes stop_codon:yes gene_type:complete
MADKLPQNIEAEEVVVGLMMLSRSCLAKGMSILDVGHFHKKAHGLIFTGMKGLFEKGRDVSLVSLTEQLKSTNTLEAIGGGLTLAELAESSISDTEFETYTTILEDKKIKRNLIVVANEIQKKGYDDVMDQDSFLKYSMDALWKATPYYSSSIQVVSSGDMSEVRREDFIKRKNRRVVNFGWSNLDELIVNGLSPGDISIMAARPGLGKSSVKTNMMYNLLERGLGVVNFGIEQGFTTEQDRLESIMTKIPLSEIIQSWSWEKGDFRLDLIKKANETIDKDYNYHIVPSRSVSVADVRSVLYQITQRQKVDVVFFDLFDKLIDVNVSANKAQTVGVKLGEISRMAEEFDCHICCLVQINRQVEGRSDKRPKISDLKDSGNYEEAARLVMLLYREKYYFQDSMNDEMEIIVAKQSNGPTGTATMIFNESTLEIEPSEGGLENF